MADTRDAERLADLRTRRADVCSPKRERSPYYGDDDIDLLFRQLARAEKVITKVRELEPVWCRGTELEIVNAVEELFDMRADYDRPTAPLDGRENDDEAK